MSPVPTFAPTMQSRIPYADYEAMPGLRISQLKHFARSPQHYQHALAHPKQTDAMRLGTAAHVAVLEPERFEAQFAVWSKRKSNNTMWPRSSPEYAAFLEANSGREVITPEDAEGAAQIQAAVRSHPDAQPYLQSGDPEVSMQCVLGHRICKGRVDWITSTHDQPVLVGLKTTVDCRAFQFRGVAAKLKYHLQWAFYFDLFECITGKQPRVKEIVVEKSPPYAVVVYDIPDVEISRGRTEYQALITQLQRCEAIDEWPGPAVGEQVLTLPDWAYANTDDASGLGLEW